MNIGIVCYPTFGGSGVVATELGLALASRGHTIHFITYNRPIRLSLFSENIFFHEVRTKDYPLFDFVPYESALASMMVDVAKYHQLDLFHVHYAVPHASVAFLAKQILKDEGLHVPVITTLHGTDITLVGKNPAYDPVVRFSIKHSDGVTAVSSFLKSSTIENFDVGHDLRVIYNFVDDKRFQRQDKDHFRKMVAPGGEKLLVHASNFRKVKRVKDVIRIFGQVRSQIKSKLLMVGDGPERAGAEELCRELNLCDDIIFLGRQSAVEEIFSIGDLFLIPSSNESFGLSALEAMACGMPVISTNAGGLPELVVDGEVGFTSEIGDIDDMARNTLKLLQDDALYTEFSINARAKAAEFSPLKIVDQYESYYKEVVGVLRSVV